MNYQDYEQYDRTALAAICQQRAGHMRSELHHGFVLPAEARGDQRTAETYRQERFAMESDYHAARSRHQQIEALRRWDARLAELKAARAEPARHAS